MSSFIHSFHRTFLGAREGWGGGREKVELLFDGERVLLLQMKRVVEMDGGAMNVLNTTEL